MVKRSIFGILTRPPQSKKFDLEEEMPLARKFLSGMKCKCSSLQPFRCEPPNDDENEVLS